MNLKTASAYFGNAFRRSSGADLALDNLYQRILIITATAGINLTLPDVRRTVISGNASELPWRGAELIIRRDPASSGNIVVRSNTDLATLATLTAGTPNGAFRLFDDSTPQGIWGVRTWL